MSKFDYRGISISGAQDVGSVEASNANQAYEILQARGITVYQLDDSSAGNEFKRPWYLREIKLGTGRIPLDQQALVAELLANLFASGIPAIEVCRVMSRSSNQYAIRQQFEKIGQHLQEGKPLGYAFEQENHLLSKEFTSFFQTGDAASTLPILLKELASLLRKRSATSGKISSALVYPVILVAASGMLLSVVIFYLAPNLEPIFTSAQKAPPPTLFTLLILNEFVREYWLALLSTLIVSTIIGLIVSRSQKVGRAFQYYRYRFPCIGKLNIASDLSRLAHTTKLLLEAGVPLPSALSQATASLPAETALTQSFIAASDALTNGSNAASAFQQQSLLPSIFKDLFRIGEETNSLPQTLEAAADALRAQVEAQTQRLLTILTPAITLLLGLGIGMLIYSILGAILDVNEIAF